MLILSRKKKQRIMIGDDIVITVLRWSSENVKIGIEAPAGMAIDREEVRMRKNQQDDVYDDMGMPVEDATPLSEPEISSIISAIKKRHPEDWKVKE